MDIKNMLDKKLVEEYKCYWEMINVIGCFSTKDIMILDALENEINNRGFEIVNSVDVIIHKD